MPEFTTTTCPRCDASTMKNWDELDRDERMLVAALPASVNHPDHEKRSLRVCTRCLHIETRKSEKRA